MCVVQAWPTRNNAFPTAVQSCFVRDDLPKHMLPAYFVSRIYFASFVFFFPVVPLTGRAVEEAVVEDLLAHVHQEEPGDHARGTPPRAGQAPERDGPDLDDAVDDLRQSLVHLWEVQQKERHCWKSCLQILHALRFQKLRVPKAVDDHHLHRAAGSSTLFHPSARNLVIDHQGIRPAAHVSLKGSRPGFIQAQDEPVDRVDVPSGLLVEHVTSARHDGTTPWHPSR
mmetsp:Transcript_75071/g.219952  ORF Transcript_75071/g.219952 Transcript_75071/m.219952 type:complete len:226 (-) Transcript_75071:311-988(-)